MKTKVFILFQLLTGSLFANWEQWNDIKLDGNLTKEIELKIELSYRMNYFFNQNQFLGEIGLEKELPNKMNFGIHYRRGEEFRRMFEYKNEDRLSIDYSKKYENEKLEIDNKVKWQIEKKNRDEYSDELLHSILRNKFSIKEKFIKRVKVSLFCELFFLEKNHIINRYRMGLELKRKLTDKLKFEITYFLDKQPTEIRLYEQNNHRINIAFDINLF